MLKYGTDKSLQIGPIWKQLSQHQHRQPSVEEKEENAVPVSEDVTTKIIGDFGRWQLKISILMALLKLPIAYYQLNIIFMAPQQEFWCTKPPTFAKYSVEEWRKICSPHVEEHPCLIFDPDLLLIDPKMDKTLIPLVPCKKFEYDLSVFKRTITSEWNLVCTRHWLVHVCQCVMMWGIVIGGIVFGSWADKHGRRKPLMTAIVIQGVTSIAASVIPMYPFFLVNWFILALASGGVGIISFVICMEVVSGKWRTLVPVIYQLPFGLGNAMMAGLAYLLRDWRQLEFTLGIFSSLFILYWFWVPESPRWLLATGQSEEAVVVLKDITRQNRRFVSSKIIRALINEHEHQNHQDPNFMAFLKSKNMRKKTLLLSMNWFCTGLAFYTFSQYLGSIGGDIFVAVSLTGIISTFGGLTCCFIITRVGRRTTVAIYQIVTASCFILILTIPRGMYLNDFPRLLFAGIGFAGMALLIDTGLFVFRATEITLYEAEISPLSLSKGRCAIFIAGYCTYLPKNFSIRDVFLRTMAKSNLEIAKNGTIPALYLFSGELFPTLGRNVGVSGVTTCARIASMVAPAVVSLDSILVDLPICILAVISFAQIFMILPLPETKDSPLPDTLEEAERF